MTVAVLLDQTAASPSRGDFRPARLMESTAILSPLKAGELGSPACLSAGALKVRVGKCPDQGTPQELTRTCCGRARDGGVVLGGSAWAVLTMYQAQEPGSCGSAPTLSLPLWRRYARSWGRLEQHLLAGCAMGIDPGEGVVGEGVPVIVVPSQVG